MVTTPQVSDMPQSSPILIPIAWKNSSTSSGVGAAPTLTDFASSRPSALRSCENIASSAAATPAASSSGTSSPACSRRTFWIAASRPFRACSPSSPGIAASFASRPAFSFSQIRGTAKKNVGFTFGRKSMIVRGSGQTVIDAPSITGR